MSDITEWVFNLGDKVKCKHTGFSGIIVGRTEFINGCKQYCVIPKEKDGKYPEDVGIDEESLKLMERQNKLNIPARTGGPVTRGMNMKGF